MTTFRFALPKTGVCDCGDDELYHPGGGPCDYHPDPLVSECSCAGFHESPQYAWTGPHVDLARVLESVRGLPTFFIFDGGTVNVLFDAPVSALPASTTPFRAWCRTVELPEDLLPLATRAREDDLVATVFLDALLERGLARAASV